VAIERRLRTRNGSATRTEITDIHSTTSNSVNIVALRHSLGVRKLEGSHWMTDGLFGYPMLLLTLLRNLCRKVLDRSRLNIVPCVVIVDKQQVGHCETCVEPRRLLDHHVDIWSDD
jgi:hypothetical protein